jgi:hypothetical protein
MVKQCNTLAPIPPLSSKEGAARRRGGLFKVPRSGSLWIFARQSKSGVDPDYVWKKTGPRTIQLNSLNSFNSWLIKL